jgi:hypothetical protein
MLVTADWRTKILAPPLLNKRHHSLDCRANKRKIVSPTRGTTVAVLSNCARSKSPQLIGTEAYNRKQSNRMISGQPIVSKENLSSAHNRLEATDNSGTEIKHRWKN